MTSYFNAYSAANWKRLLNTFHAYVNQITATPEADLRADIAALKDGAVIKLGKERAAWSTYFLARELQQNEWTSVLNTLTASESFKQIVFSDSLIAGTPTQAAREFLINLPRLDYYWRTDLSESGLFEISLFPPDKLGALAGEMVRRQQLLSVTDDAARDLVNQEEEATEMNFERLLNLPPVRQASEESESASTAFNPLGPTVDMLRHARSGLAMPKSRETSGERLESSSSKRETVRNRLTTEQLRKKDKEEKASKAGKTKPKTAAELDRDRYQARKDQIADQRREQLREQQLRTNGAQAAKQTGAQERPKTMNPATVITAVTGGLGAAVSAPIAYTIWQTLLT